MADRAELVKRLNDEGDFGADYIEELLNIADLDGDIEIGIEADRASVAVVTEGVADRRLKRLIGQGGQVLDALQELTRLAVQAKTGERSRLMLDIADYRESHRQEVAAIAQEAVASVLANGEPVSLAPMNPFERKVVHDIAAAAGLASDSEGVGNARHVVITLKSSEELSDVETEDAEEADAEKAVGLDAEATTGGENKDTVSIEAEDSADVHIRGTFELPDSDQAASTPVRTNEDSAGSGSLSNAKPLAGNSNLGQETNHLADSKAE